MAEKDSSIKILSDNRQASHNYFLMDRFEAGMVLTGTEVKAAKDGQIQKGDRQTPGRDAGEGAIADPHEGLSEERPDQVRGGGGERQEVSRQARDGEGADG